MAIAVLPPLSVYVHWPWCIQKCPYCDFNSHVSPKADVDSYVQALLQDLRQQLPWVQGRLVQSVFFGGGTPSLASPVMIQRILSELDSAIGLAAGCEITLEANPGTVDAQHFAGYLQAGVNRLSLGVQSFHDQLLQPIGRIHDGQQAERAIKLAQDVGFQRINLDLMVGLPNQTRETALQDIERALSFDVEHVSHYQLTLEPNTPFFARPPVGLPEPDEADDLQLLCHDRLIEAGWQRYEVSAWHSATGEASQHNLNYWRFGDYLGLGAGAHGKITFLSGKVMRTQHAKSPIAYQQDVTQGKLPQVAEIAVDALPFEFLMNALRLQNGVDSCLWDERTGLSLNEIAAVWQVQVDKGLLAPMGSRLQTTPMGYRYLNQLLTSFL